ncbi:MAG: ribosome maturation factor RimP [Gammaproteobacteria bacterium]|nr:MAG: ribosome maturation factor RimP [Gammaproteobacteria bacterium]
MLKQKLREVLEPSVTGLGFELVDVELSGSGAQTVLRLYIDSPQGITVEDCADVSRQVSAVLDVEDPLPGQYMLEVSSPGLDRPLVKPADFEKVVGQEVRVRMYEAVLGRKNFSGRLVAARDEYVLVDVDKERYELAYAAMEKARLVPDL